MRVAMYYSNKDIRIEEMPAPEVEAGELLMKVEASGICGTDVVEWYRKDKVPLVLGHEVAGTITKVGPGINDYKEGMRISVSHHVPCGECHYCLLGHETVCETLRKTKFYPGGFSEYLKIPAINIEKGGVYSLPDEVSFEEATFIEPLACVLRGERLAGAGPGKTILIIGSGLSGILHIQWARLLGAAKIIALDIMRFRIEAAKKFGADLAVNAQGFRPEDISKINNGRRADLVIICTGADSAYPLALDCVDRGGTILFFAATGEGFKIPLPVNDVFWRNEVTLTSSYAGSPADHREALEAIKSRRINVKDMITHRLRLAKAAEGFRLVSEAGNSLKVIIEPGK